MKTHIGAPGDPNMLGNLKKKAQHLKDQYKMEKSEFEKAINSLLDK